VPTDNDWSTWHPWFITDHQKLVLFTEDIARATSHIFTCIRDKDGWSIEEKHDYNMETLRIEKAGGDISKRKIFKMYFGTTVRDVKRVSF